MSTPKTTTLLLTFALYCGCSMTSAPNDVGFDSSDSIHSLAGCFTNHGEGGNNTTRQFLSLVIWPTADLDPSTIKAIRVMAVDKKTLKITAETDGNVIYESLFVEGRDFYLKSGRISVNERTVASFAYPPGNVFIGIEKKSTELGIDKNGDGKLQKRSAFAGTAFLVFPIAGGTQDSYRFTKNQELCK